MNQACAIHFAAMIAIHTTISITSLLSVHLPIMKCIYHISSSISYHCYYCWSWAAKPAEEKPKEKPKEEVVDALDGGMDMFGGGGGGGGDY